jgi:probable addiction module antidote protein
MGRDAARRGSTGLVEDEMSQVLLLKDALDCGDAAALVRAFELVARTRGLRSIACSAGVGGQVLMGALEGPNSPDLRVLSRVVAALVRSVQTGEP